MGDKYLSQVLTVDDILHSSENRLCILAGVGAGKNYFVTNELAGHGNIFFITSRRAKVNEMLLEEICEENVNWNKFHDEVFTTTNYGIELLVKNKRFSDNGIKNIIERFDIIVVDEFHSLNADATFANSTFHLYTFLEHISKDYPDIKIVVMTGTPEPVQSILDRDNYKIIDKREECINVIPSCISVIKKADAIEMMRHLCEDQQTVYYTNSANSAIFKDKKSLSYYAKLCEGGIYNEHDIAFATADKKALEIMDKANIPEKLSYKKALADNIGQREYKHIYNLNRKVDLIKKYLIRKKRLPNNARILLTTSTLKEGINIESKRIQVAFCESHLLSDIQQFAGRFRYGLETLYIINNAKQFDINEEQYRHFFLEMLFNFEVVKTINSFLDSKIKNEKSALYMNDFGKFKSNNIELFDLLTEKDFSIGNVNDAISTFIDSIEKRFNYIRFNHIESEFQFFKSAFIEQKRIFEYYSSGWEKHIRTFCKENNIVYLNNTDSKEINTIAITEDLQVYLGKKLIGVEKTKFLLFISNAFGLTSKRPQKGTINELFAQHNIPYRINDGNTKGKRYYEVVRKTDFTTK